MSRKLLITVMICTAVLGTALAAAREYNVQHESINNEETAESLLLLSLFYQDQGRYAAAKDVLYEYLQHNPDQGWVWVLIGDLDYLLGDYDLALKSYVKALMVGDYARSYYGIGLINSQQGITADVIGAFKKAVEIAPSFVEARIALAKVYLHTEQYEEARTQLETAYLYAPRDAKIHYYLWKVYTIESDQSKARHHGELAVQYDPGYAELIDPK
ncbi:MAG: tetratricopeptide repeat protein [Firmicutes bacterium]|nr:tetratricopeptide repeat protein [Bacillota bacterium]NLL89333.1 tetratricopeptide repeat protein [Bacillota bacterium]HKM17968.1 tetratricopeptide repeat protein [Limnochordia bacterium]